VDPPFGPLSEGVFESDSFNVRGYPLEAAPGGPTDLRLSGGFEGGPGGPREALLTPFLTPFDIKVLLEGFLGGQSGGSGGPHGSPDKDPRVTILVHVVHQKH